MTDLADAHAVIECYFEAVREHFAPHFERVSRTKLFVAPCTAEVCVRDTERHYAGCSLDGRSIVCAPEMADLEYHVVVGILFHEFGHSVDYLYPGEFILGPEPAIGARTARRRRREDVSDTQWIRWQKQWDQRDDDVIEFTADAIASGVAGAPILYGGPCILQNFRTGEARPYGLR